MTGECPSEARILLALDRELDAGDQAIVDQHVQQCSSCRETRDRLARLSSEIARYCGISRPAAPGERSVVAAASPTARISRRWLGALAAAALLLMAAGAAYLATRGDILPRPRQAAGQSAEALPAAPPAAGRAETGRVTAPEPSAVETASSPTPPTPVKAPRRRVRPPRSTPVSTDADRRGPTYYWALPYANGAVPLNEGSVVMTVRLSRDQLRLAGIPVSAQPAPDQDRALMRARVLVGADGLPRAISFDQN